MNQILELVDDLDSRIAAKSDEGSIRLRLAKLRVAVQGLVDDNARLRVALEAQKMTHLEKETTLRKIIADLIELQQSFAPAIKQTESPPPRPPRKSPPKKRARRPSA